MPISGSDKALMVARLGVMRLGASRLNYAQPVLSCVINGVPRNTSNVRLEGFSVQDELDSIPNTATLRVQGFVPSVGHTIQLYLGSTQPSHLLFAGKILNLTQVYDLLPTQLAYDLQCISWEWMLNKNKVTERFLSESASDMVRSLLTAYAPEFDPAGVEDGLPSLDEITFTNEDLIDCLDRIADRIGGHWVTDYSKVLHFGLALEPGASAVHPITDTDPHGLIRIALSTDLSQVRTRVLVEGGGAQSAAECLPGETIVPVEDPVWYSATGGTVVSGPQRISYSAIQAGGGGALVGTPATPTSGPTLTPSGTGSLGAGTYGYAVVFVSATGKTLPSPMSSVNLAAPSVNPPTTGHDSGIDDHPSYEIGHLDLNARYNYCYTFYESGTGKETTPSPLFGDTLDGPSNALLIVKSMIQAPPAGLIRRWYRTEGNGSVYHLRKTGDLESSGTYPTHFVDFDADSTLNTSVHPPSVNGFGGPTAVAVSSIATGPTGTTGRELYRTAVNSAAPLKLLTTIANNTTTTYTDTAADAALGAAPPSSDTSGLVSEGGIVKPGETSIIVSSVTPFSTTGGWAGVGGQQVRYTGVSGSSLVVSSTAIEAPINYGSEITALPALTGIPASGTGSIQFAIARGDEVNLLVTRDDGIAQVNLAALLSTAEDPHDGIVEDYIQDRRLSQTECENRGDARLLEVKDPEVHVQYETRDQTTRTGRDVTITLTAPAVNGTFKIQRVSIGQFDPLFRLQPVRAVEASSRKFSLEQLLRLVKAA